MNFIVPSLFSRMCSWVSGKRNIFEEKLCIHVEEVPLGYFERGLLHKGLNVGLVSLDNVNSQILIKSSSWLPCSCDLIIANCNL